MRYGFKALPWGLIGLCAAEAFADPVLIYDTGQTRPIGEYVQMTEPAAPPSIPAMPSGEQAAAEFLAALFPIRTPELSPGPVSPSAVDIALPQPFFLVGDDPLSQAWLNQHRARLAEINAVGMVVNVASAENFKALQKIAGDAIPLTPAPGSDLLHALQGVQLTHYPVLISARRIEQ